MNSKIIMSPGVGANSPGISLNFPHSSIFKPKCTTVYHILDSLVIRVADDKSLVLFNTIALSNGDIDNCLSALELLNYLTAMTREIP